MRSMANYFVAASPDSLPSTEATIDSLGCRYGEPNEARASMTMRCTTSAADGTSDN